MSEYTAMPRAITRAFEKSNRSVREVAREAGVSPATLSTSLREPVDMKLSTLIRIWKALGFSVSIYCQGPGKEMYAFEEKEAAT